jgi:vacuolar-type H+-ATPase subunit I/STV1
MFEHTSEPLLPRRAFVARLLQSFVAGALLVLFSLALGMLGYRWLEGLNWIDAFLNSAMLMAGMGPVNAPLSFGGKLFAGLYALYCGLVLILVAGLIFAPVVHRSLHKFHLRHGKP